MATFPRIGVGTTGVHGANDGATFPETSAGKERHFTGPYERQVIGGVGHFVQRERPDAGIGSVLAHLRPASSSWFGQAKPFRPLARSDSLPGPGPFQPHLSIVPFY